VISISNKEVASLADVPIDRVMQLRSQGYSNSQVADYLRREGVSPSMINEAIAQADAKSGADGTYNSAQGQGMPQRQADQSNQGMDQSGSGEAAADDGAEIEELIEEIIDEKWKELVKDIKKIAEWKDKTDERMLKLDQSFTDLKGNFESLHKALLGKIGEYDKNILDVGTDIKAMEKVFEKVLPRFTENVNELSRITRTMKLGTDEHK